MPNFYGYESLANVLAAHEAAVELAERKQRLALASAGKQLLTKIVHPCTAPGQPKYFDSAVRVRHLRRRLYDVEGSFALEPTVVGDNPALARLVLSGTYRTLAARRQGTALVEDPLHSLVPQTADLTLVLTDFERPHIVTSQLWARFDQEHMEGEATGFSDPHAGHPLAYDSNHYEGIVETLGEALKIQQLACGV